MKRRILQEHPDVICEKYPLVYGSSDSNSNQTKLIIQYFRTTVTSAIPNPIKQLTNTKLFIKIYKEQLILEIPE